LFDLDDAQTEAAQQDFESGAQGTDSVVAGASL
jgi:hypothetical protein